ncbi:MAG: NAD(P)-binding domain-containing protein [Anaerolineae bacterium]
MDEAVFVVGAGPAGISSAYYLAQAGIPYRAVDRASVIASTWANQYPSLRLNTAGFVSHLPGQRIPLRAGIYPMGRDFYAYISDYMQHHSFNIELGVEVRRVAPDGDQWLVETSRDSGRYRFVIIASGRFGNPYLPHIPGVETFSGRCLHSRDFTNPNDFAGQRVLVVGNGPSGVDIAAALTPVARHPVLLAIRSDMVIARQYPYGLPTAGWVLLASLLPKRWRKRFLNRVNYQTYNDLADLDLPLAPNRDDRVGTSAPARGRELIDAIRGGTIKAVAGLERLDGRCAVLMDGSSHEVDAVIMCTGFRPMLNYLDIDYETDKDGWLVRSDPRGTEIAGYPGLFLVGRYYRGLGPLYNIRHEARVTVDTIAARLQGKPRGKLRLPEPIE